MFPASRSAKDGGFAASPLAGPKLARHRIDIVILGIQCHRARSLHRLDGLHNAELIRCILVRNCDCAVATRSKSETRSWIEAVGVDAFPDGHGSGNLSVGVIPKFHQSVVAADDEQRMRDVNLLS